MVLSCTGGYNGASLSAGGQYFSPARSSVTNLVARISCCLFENNKKCVSPNTSGLTHFCYTIFL